MGEVIVTIQNRSFKLGCDDGEEEHLKILAGHIGKHVSNLRETIGKTGDDQLYLMAGLMVCDELWDARDLLMKTRELLQRQSGQNAGSPSDTSNVATISTRPARRPAGQPLQSARVATPPPVPMPSDSRK